MAAPLDEELIRKLEALRMAARRLATVPREGDRLSRRRGRSSDFVSHRPYAAGDDPRTIDWSAYGRLEELLVKQFAREEAVTVDIFPDTSASMGFGTPSKLSLAVRLAQTFGYLALSGHGHVSLHLPAPRTFEGKPGVLPMLAALGGVRAAGAVSPLPSLRTLLPRERGKGLVLLLGDLGSIPSEEDLRRLRAGFGHFVGIAILAPEELEPSLEGKFALRDSETGERLELHVDAVAREEYRARLRAMLAETEERFRRHEATFLQFRSDAALEEAFFVTVREAGLVA